ncbi:hypothetical protein QYZ87_09005 [Porphyromonadaceae bacterium W3.11]|nr:hypothetical protein [Porphyromonadaceae bacterium W3.11]
MILATTFSRDYAPDDWKALADTDPRKKEYPVVAMIFPKSVKESLKKWGKLPPIKIEELRVFDDYDELLQYRDRML